MDPASVAVRTLYERAAWIARSVAVDSCTNERRALRDTIVAMPRDEDDLPVRTRGRAKRLVVPVALTVVTLGALATAGGALAGLAASAGCDDGTPHVDAAVDAAFDAAPDTPIV